MLVLQCSKCKLSRVLALAGVAFLLPCGAGHGEVRVAYKQALVSGELKTGCHCHFIHSLMLGLTRFVVLLGLGGLALQRYMKLKSK